MGTSPNDLPPIVGDVLVQPRLLVTPQQVQAAIDDVNKLMQNTHTFFRDYEREIFRRMPGDVKVDDAVKADLNAMQTLWFNLLGIRNRLIVHLYYLEHPQGGTE
jgi:hypothetical protein